MHYFLFVFSFFFKDSVIHRVHLETGLPDIGQTSISWVFHLQHLSTSLSPRWAGLKLQHTLFVVKKNDLKHKTTGSFKLLRNRVTATFGEPASLLR